MTDPSVQSPEPVCRCYAAFLGTGVERPRLFGAGGVLFPGRVIAALRQRAVGYAGRHALAFALWRWRAALKDRTALKQRVRELEAELTRRPREER